MKNLELELWQRIAGFEQSVSHDFHHIERVQRFAEELRSTYGGDSDVLTAATILHDLGRGDLSRRHGIESIEASRERAEVVLEYVSLPAAKKAKVLKAIETHDQPDLRPNLIEARILKDADFLAGFGAWGVLRIAMWSGETGRRVDEVVAKISEGMQRRFDSLEFQKSRELARREILFSQLFLTELCNESSQHVGQLGGLYVVLEGISGSGKNTIAEMVADLVRDMVPDVVQVVEEPGEAFRELRAALDNRRKLDETLMKGLFHVDRCKVIEERVRPALMRGGVVLSVRSHLSTAVYQCESSGEALLSMLAYEWIPACDLLILLDVNEEEALRRIAARRKAPGDYETRQELQKHRKRYRELAPIFNAKEFRVIDANRPKEDVAGDVREEVLAALERQQRS